MMNNEEIIQELAREPFFRDLFRIIQYSGKNESIKYQLSVITRTLKFAAKLKNKNYTLFSSIVFALTIGMADSAIRYIEKFEHSKITHSDRRIINRLEFILLIFLPIDKAEDYYIFITNKNDKWTIIHGKMRSKFLVCWHTSFFVLHHHWARIVKVCGALIGLVGIKWIKDLATRFFG